MEKGPPSKAESTTHAQQALTPGILSAIHERICTSRQPEARSPYLLGSGGGRSSDVGALARGAAEGCSSKARRGQRGFGSVGGAGVVGLPESWARGPEGLLALRQALILQHLLWAQHTPPSHWARSTLARGPVAL